MNEGKDIRPTFRARNDVVIIERTEVSWGGVIRPENAKIRYEKYSTVIGVGPLVKDLEVGDKVIGLFSGAVPLHTKLPIYAMSEDVVFAVVTGGEGVQDIVPAGPSKLIKPTGRLELVPPVGGGKKRL